MLLTIGMMVKNEEKHLTESLTSLIPILEELDAELVIVDTGSTDRTVEIAKQFTDRVYFHKWNDDFSAMRNKVIDYAEGDWFFTLDGDEVIENPAELIKFMQSDDKDKFNTILVTQKNFTDFENNKFSPLAQARLFRNDGYFHYEGAVHNQPIFKKPAAELKLVLNHYGYLKDDQELMERKFKRTSTILKRELKKEPENIYYWYQLSKSYSMHKDHHKALETIEKAYQIAKKNKINLEPRMYIYTQFARLKAADVDPLGTEKICEESLKVKSGYLDIYYYLAWAKMTLKKYDDALDFYKKYLKLYNNFDGSMNQKDIAVAAQTLGDQSSALTNLIRLLDKQEMYNKIITYAEQINEIETINNIGSLVIKAYLKTDQIDNLYNLFIKAEPEFKENWLDSWENYLINNKDSLANSVNRLFAKFSEAKDDYSILNRVRLNIFKDREIKITDVVRDKIKNIDFIDKSDYYADIVYYLVKVKDLDLLSNIVARIRENDLNLFFRYLKNKYDDLSRIVENLLVSYDFNNGDFVSNKLVKNLCRYLFSLDQISENKKGIIINLYINSALDYIKTIYSKKVLENELIKDVKNKEESFLIYLFKAMQFKEKDLKQYIKYLRKSLNIFTDLGFIIEYLLDELKKVEKINKIEKLIQNGNYNIAEKLIYNYKDSFNIDNKYISILSSFYIYKGNFNKSRETIIKGLQNNLISFDILYNLTYINIINEDFEDALYSFYEAKKYIENSSEKNDLDNLYKKIPDSIDIKENRFALFNPELQISCKPFFIIGCGRSGSTLLRSILNNSTDISIPPENILLARIIDIYNKYKFLPWGDILLMIFDIFKGAEHYKFWNIDLDYIYKILIDIDKSKRTLRVILDELYKRFAKENFPEAIRWGDKTPLNSINIDLINSAFPNSSYIHLIRDGRDVVSSYLYSTDYINNVNIACERWINHVNNCLEFSKKINSDRYLEIYYEDLVNRPKTEIRKICNFIGVNYSDDLLLFHDKLDKLTDTKVKQHKNLYKQINNNSVGKWEKNLTETEKNIVDLKLDFLLKKLNYK